MRTTITLDEDTANQIQEAMRRTGRTFRETVNEAIRVGLSSSTKVHRAGKFRVEARDLGLRSGMSYDNIGELLEQLEGPSAP
jgi:hypothetical protein